MFRKIIIRLCILMLMLAAVLFGLAAKSDHDYFAGKTNSAAIQNADQEQGGRKEFIIWESFSRSLMSTVKF